MNGDPGASSGPGSARLPAAPHLRLDEGGLDAVEGLAGVALLPGYGDLRARGVRPTLRRRCWRRQRSQYHNKTHTLATLVVCPVAKVSNNAKK